MKFYSLIFKKTKLANEIESVIKKELSLASFYTNPNYHVYVECNSPVFQNNQQGQLDVLLTFDNQDDCSQLVIQCKMKSF